MRLHVGGVGIGLRHIPNEDAVDDGGVYFAVGESSFRGLDGQVGAGKVFELSSESAESSALGGNDEDSGLRKMGHYSMFSESV